MSTLVVGVLEDRTVELEAEGVGVARDEKEPRERFVWKAEMEVGMSSAWNGAGTVNAGNLPRDSVPFHVLTSPNDTKQVLGPHIGAFHALLAG